MDLRIKLGKLYIEKDGEQLDLDHPEAGQKFGRFQIAVGNLVMIDKEGILRRTFSREQVAEISEKLKEQKTGWRIPEHKDMEALMELAVFGRLKPCDWPNQYKCDFEHLNLYGGHYFVALDGSFCVFDFHDKGEVQFYDDENMKSQIELIRED